MGDRAVFLTAAWRHLAMLNFEVDPGLVAPLVPAGTELDAWRGRTLVSLVGFLFLDTRVLGVPIPLHRDFEEVNLRFYVRHKAGEGWRRGVVFVKELVPRAAVALTARILYGENYVALPMSHRIELVNDSAGPVRQVSYRWSFMGGEHGLHVTARGEPREVAEDSEAAFITEHYWGYARRRGGGTLEYRVEHPRWRVWAAQEARFEGDAGPLYGAGFAAPLNAAPSSAFLAEGSEVTVSKGAPLAR